MRKSTNNQKKENNFTLKLTNSLRKIDPFTQEEQNLQLITVNSNQLQATINNVVDISVAFETQQLLVKSIPADLNNSAKIEIFSFGHPKNRFSDIYNVEVLPKTFLEVNADTKLTDSAIPLLPKFKNFLPFNQAMSDSKHQNVDKIYFHPCLHQSSIPYLNKLAAAHMKRLHSKPES